MSSGSDQLPKFVQPLIKEIGPVDDFLCQDVDLEHQHQKPPQRIIDHSEIFIKVDNVMSEFDGCSTKFLVPIGLRSGSEKGMGCSPLLRQSM